MLKSIQDPELAPIYEGLPDIGYDNFCHQFLANVIFLGIIDPSANTVTLLQSEWGSLPSRTFKTGSTVTPFRKLLSLLQNMCVNCVYSRLVRALLFEKSGFFVNPARVSPDVLISDFGRLKIKEPSSVAVCLMTGIITDCSIISEGVTGGPDNEKTVHKVSIAPFRQDFRRDTTMWGKILYFDNLSCAISTEGMSFTTKPRTISAPVFSSGMFFGSVLEAVAIFPMLYLQDCPLPELPKKQAPGL